MGKTKTTTETVQKAEPTEEERELNRMQLEQQKAIQPYAIPMQQQAYTLGQQLLTGQQLPGYLGQLPQGATATEIPLSAGVFGEDLTSEIVRESMRDIMPQFEAMGLPIESGVAQSVMGRTAGDIRRQVGESNLERQLMIRGANVDVQMATQYQNLNNLLNLLNLAVGGQAQIQQPVIQTGATLGQRLAGLRTITGQQTQTRNPFLESFYGSLGSSMGQGIGGGITGGLPGFGQGGMFGCWVAAEVFGGWEKPKTILARFYIRNIAPLWFRNFYMKYGERIAKFIHNKLILKIIIRPLFEMFALVGKCQLEVNYA